MQMPCPGCGEPKLVFSLRQRKHGTTKCHTCVLARKASKPAQIEAATMIRITRSASRKINKLAKE